MGGASNKQHTSKKNKGNAAAPKVKKGKYTARTVSAIGQKNSTSFRLSKAENSASPSTSVSLTAGDSTKRRSSKKQRFRLLSAVNDHVDVCMLKRRPFVRDMNDVKGKEIIEFEKDNHRNKRGSMTPFLEPYIKTRAQKNKYSKTDDDSDSERDENLKTTDPRSQDLKVYRRIVDAKQVAFVEPEEETTEGSDDVSETRKNIEGSGEEDDGEAEIDNEVDDDDDSIKLEVPGNVVKVYCTHCWPSFSYPWTTAGQTHSSSTGIVYNTSPGSRMLLTNAHSVQYAAVVQVRKRGDHQKYEAKVLCIGYDCDLALLTVEEDQFWENLSDVRWGTSPHLEDPVTVVGYPVGGDNTSVTQGVVSRIDYQRYTVGSCHLLAIQIDAAINGGNSGGPALNSNKECVGIAFQSLKDSETENIGYIIPCEVVFHFMEDYKRHGKYTGFGSCSFIWQKVENKSMQEFYGIKESGNGVLISKIDKTSPAHGILKKGDIVMSIDNSPIATDGTVAFTNGERIAFEWMLCQKFPGDKVNFSVIRNRRKKEIMLEVVRVEPLVPTYLPEEQKPEYFIAGGLVFIPLTELFLTSEYGQDCLCRAPAHLVTVSSRFHRDFEQEQIVVIGHVLAHEITIGYEDFVHYCVKQFNGNEIRNLSHLVELVENCTDEYWRFDLACDKVLIMNAKAAKNSLVDILQQNMIPAAKSATKSVIKSSTTLAGKSAIKSTPVYKAPQKYKPLGKPEANAKNIGS